MTCYDCLKLSFEDRFKSLEDKIKSTIERFNKIQNSQDLSSPPPSFEQIRDVDRLEALTARNKKDIVEIYEGIRYINNQFANLESRINKLEKSTTKNKKLK